MKINRKGMMNFICIFISIPSQVSSVYVTNSRDHLHFLSLEGVYEDREGPNTVACFSGR